MILTNKMQFFQLFYFSYCEHVCSFNQGQFFKPITQHERCSNIDALLNKSCLVMETDFNIDPHNSTIHTILITNWKLIHLSLDTMAMKTLNCQKHVSEWKHIFHLVTIAT